MNFYFACCYCHAYDYFQEEAKKITNDKEEQKKILPKKRNKEYSMYYVVQNIQKKFNV